MYFNSDGFRSLKISQEIENRSTHTIYTNKNTKRIIGIGIRLFTGRKIVTPCLFNIFNAKPDFSKIKYAKNVSLGQHTLTQI